MSEIVDYLPWWGWLIAATSFVILCVVAINATGDDMSRADLVSPRRALSRDADPSRIRPAGFMHLRIGATGVE